MSPAITAAIVSCHYLAKIIYRKPKIVSPVISDDNQPTYTKNSLTFKDIDFYYPTRPNVQILQQFSLHVPEGKTIALVGSSGSGKSTCMQILERFYDPQHGHVYVGNDNIFTDISLTNLRSRISIVSQEPVLFDRSIADNIAYGCNEREVTMVDIIEAAKMANIHEFIASLPLVSALREIVLKFRITHSYFIYFRDTKQNWERKGHNYPVDRNNVSQLLGH